MATIDFSAQAFRDQFPGQFPDPPYTDTVLQFNWDTAICYISDDDYGCLQGDCRQRAINLMVAHLIALNSNVDANTGLVQQGGFVDSASIDKITVSVKAFESQSQFQWWLQQTPYGTQLYALLYVKSVGGMFIGGSNELGSFRRSAGRFLPTRS